MKRLYKSLLCSIVALALAAGLAGCRSQKGASAPTGDAPVQPTVSGRTPDSDFRMLTDCYKPWRSVSMPIKVKMTSPKRASLSGTLDMEYGKAMAINLRMLFINALTIYADNETILLVSKPLDICYESGIGEFTAATGLDLRDLQSFFLGQLFEPGFGTATSASRSTFDLSDFDLGAAYAELTAMDIRPKHKGAPGVDWYFRTVALRDKPDTAPALQKLDISARTAHFDCTFADAMDSPAGQVAGKLEIDGKVKNNAIEAQFITDPESARWNQLSGISKPKIPAGMRRMTTEQIFRILKK